MYVYILAYTYIYIYIYIYIYMYIITHVCLCGCTHMYCMLVEKCRSYQDGVLGEGCTWTERDQVRILPIPLIIRPWASPSWLHYQLHLSIYLSIYLYIYIYIYI